MSVDLKPCPFCGERAEMNYAIEKALIECTNAKCTVRPSTWLTVKTDKVSELVKAWNKREDD